MDDPSTQINTRIKVSFSTERALKAGRFHDPNALYFKMFEKKPPEKDKKKEAEQQLPKISGTLGVSGQ